MLAPGAPKDNENPIIHAVEEDEAHSYKRPIGWSQLKPFHVIPPKDDQDLPFQCQSAADRAVVHALLDTFEASQGEGVALLRKAGLGLPKYSTISNFSARPYKEQLQSTPQFMPAGCSRGSGEDKGSDNHDRDSITQDEIFAIIRNIQDPEHAGVTLEQLRVVSRRQIEIQAADTPKGDVMSYTNSAGSLPSVTVRFT